MNKLIKFWGDLRSSFWFMPSLMIAWSIVLAVLLINADSATSDQWLSQWPRLFGVGADGARAMLSTLAGSMMTVMGITFSMTLLALSLASNQYSSRVLRNFMRSRTTQLTLGVFAGIFAYCLIVLRTIRGSGGVGEFVPSLAVFLAFIMALGGIGILIYFIHHIASSIQASNIIASVAEETNASIDRLLPEKSEHESDEPEHLIYKLDEFDARVWYPLSAASSGYIQSVDTAMLMRLAQEHRTVVRMERGTGAFVVQNTPLVSLALTYPPEQKTIDAFNAAYNVGCYRVVELDPAFGIRQIVDIALKALSPGVNDTSTAVICVDYLSSIMARLAGRQFPLVHHYEEDTLRVIAIVPSFESLLSEAFDQIRANAETNVAILLRMLSGFAAIGSLTMKPSHIRSLDEQLQWIAELVERCIPATHDRALLERRLSQVHAVLKAEHM